MSTSPVTPKKGAKHIQRHIERKWENQNVVYLLYQHVMARTEQKLLFLPHNTPPGYFWWPGGEEGWKTGHKGKNVVPVVVL